MTLISGDQPVEGSGNGLSASSNLDVVAVAALSDGRHDASVCQICANRKKAQGI